jgi:uncharacterized membrane protein HdeD (DUF308 family)
MLEWIVLVLLAGILCSIGGILHVIVPPYDTDAASALRRYGASWVVGLVMGTVLPDPSQYAFPSPEILAYVIGLIALGYTAIDVVIQWLKKQEQPPAEPEPAPPTPPGS